MCLDDSNSAHDEDGLNKSPDSLEMPSYAAHEELNHSEDQNGNMQPEDEYDIVERKQGMSFPFKTFYFFPVCFFF